MQITGMLNSSDEIKPLSYRMLRIAVTSRNRMENGHRRGFLKGSIDQ
jgi:hypothetical protein